MPNKKVTPHHLFQLIKNGDPEVPEDPIVSIVSEIGSEEDLRDYRIKLILDRSKKQLADMKMDFRLQEKNQEIEELQLANLQYQADLEHIEKCKREQALDNNNNYNEDLKRILDSNVERDEQLKTLRARNASLLQEKDELTKKGDRFKGAYGEFKRSFEDLRTNYEEVCAKKKAELIKDARITKLMNREKDAEIEKLTKMNAELQEQLQKKSHQNRLCVKEYEGQIDALNKKHVDQIGALNKKLEEFKVLLTGFSFK